MANIDARIIVEIEISTIFAIICWDNIDININESFVVLPCGHVTHLDCMCLHITTIGEPKTCSTCSGDLSIEETEGEF